MNTVYKLLCLAATFAFCSSGFAEAPSEQSELAKNCPTKSCKPDCPVASCPKKKSCDEPFEQGMILPCGKYPCAYNAPAGICLRNAWDFNIFGSFIYWYAAQDDMDIAHVPPEPTLLPTVVHGATVLYQNFNYEPGFKVGFGFNTDYDSWAFRAEYIWLHETQSTSPTAAPPLPSGDPALWSESDWFFSDTTDSFISSNWRLKLDMVDAVMTRPFYQGTRLTVSPFGGLRGLWLRQKLTITGTSAFAETVNSVNLRSTSWAVGPATGVGGHWLLGGGFRFEGNATASLLYTRYTKISAQENHSAASLPYSSSVKGLNAVRPIAQLNVGLGWGTYFHGCSSDWYLDIALDYEFLEFWHQNMMRSFASSIRGYADDIGDLTMHGLTATVRFDF